MARTDAELVEAALKGDAGAFEEIVGRYQRLVFKIIYHYVGSRGEVEDLAQDVFLKVFRALDTFDTRRAFKSWVSRITANTCLDQIRKARLRKVQTFTDLAPDDEGRIHFLVDRVTQRASLTEDDEKELFTLLEKLMEQLNPKDKMAFVLRELEGLSYPEVAESLGTSEVAARIRVSRSKKRLQEALNRVVESKGG